MGIITAAIKETAGNGTAKTEIMTGKIKGAGR